MAPKLIILGILISFVPSTQKSHAAVSVNEALKQKMLQAYEFQANTVVRMMSLDNNGHLYLDLDDLGKVEEIGATLLGKDTACEKALQALYERGASGPSRITSRHPGNKELWEAVNTSQASSGAELRYNFAKFRRKGTPLLFEIKSPSGRSVFVSGRLPRWHKADPDLIHLMPPSHVVNALLGQDKRTWILPNPTQPQIVITSMRLAACPPEPLPLIKSFL